MSNRLDSTLRFDNDNSLALSSHALSKIFHGPLRLAFRYRKRRCRRGSSCQVIQMGCLRDLRFAHFGTRQKKFIWKTLERPNASCYCPRIIVIEVVTTACALTRQVPAPVSLSATNLRSRVSM
jgi:hypothetical protein